MCGFVHYIIHRLHYHKIPAYWFLLLFTDEQHLIRYQKEGSACEYQIVPSEARRHSLY